MEAKEASNGDFVRALVDTGGNKFEQKEGVLMSGNKLVVSGAEKPFICLKVFDVIPVSKLDWLNMLLLEKTLKEHCRT